MASIRFTSFLLGLMLFLIAVRDSIADSYQALEKMPVAGVNLPPATEGITVTLNKEIVGNGVPAAEVKNTRLGGRKMMLKRALGKEMVEAEGGYGGASQTSSAAHFVGNRNHKGKGMLNVEGKDIYASKKLLGTSEDNMIYQNHRSMLPAKSLMNSENLTTSRKGLFYHPNTQQSWNSECVSTSLECSSRSKNSIPQESNNPFEQLVSQKLLGPAAEIVKLVHQDYQGSSGPGHKPPINNAGPLSQEHLMP